MEFFNNTKLSDQRVLEVAAALCEAGDVSGKIGVAGSEHHIPTTDDTNGPYVRIHSIRTKDSLHFIVLPPEPQTSNIIPFKSALKWNRLKRQLGTALGTDFS